MGRFVFYILCALGLLFFVHGAMKGWVNQEVRAQVAEKSNKVTNETLQKINEDLQEVTLQTKELRTNVTELATSTQNGLSRVRKEIAHAKQITLSDPLSPPLAESLCLQYHKANSRNALHGKTLSGTVLQLSPDAFAKQCRTAWRGVTWGDVIEWLLPLMEHDGNLQLQLDAGRAYYSPQNTSHSLVSGQSATPFNKGEQ